mgnify:CR=1 FL=1
MKKKVMCMLLTGVMAAGMFAGCGSSDTADTTTDAAATTDAASTADAADTTSEAAPAENADFDHTSTLYPVRMVPAQEEHSSSCSVWKKKMRAARKWITPQRKRSSPTARTLCSHR